MSSKLNLVITAMSFSDHEKNIKIIASLLRQDKAVGLASGTCVSSLAKTHKIVVATSERDRYVPKADQ